MARQSGTYAARRCSACFEPLEQRQLLAANILASVDGTLWAAGDTNQLQLDFAGSSAILGFRMRGTGGTLDPDSVSVCDLADHTIAPVVAAADVNGSNDSLVLVDLGFGSYTLTTRGEGLTTGAYQIQAFLPGDANGDGQVGEDELHQAEAAAVQTSGGWNFVTQTYYATFGIDLTEDLYLEEFDCDADGEVDSFDLGVVTWNASSAPVSINLIADMKAPDIQADLVNDTGSSNADGISQDVTIAGTVWDDHQIVEFRAGVDGMAQADYVSLLGEVDAQGNFELDLTRLEEIADASLANNGLHTLFLIAKDEYGNESATPYEVPFELDTITPAVPTGLNLVPGSDLGFFDDDDITADNTPTIEADAEDGSLVKLYSNINIDSLVGEDTAGSTASITTSTLSDGTHQLTATATDRAGNTSGVSAPLEIVIETVDPIEPEFILAAADDTPPVGDRLTANTLVTLEGTAEAGSLLTLNDDQSTSADGSTGAFAFTNVPLYFGPNPFRVVSMDLAGNESDYSRIIHQNNAPTLGTPVGPVSVDEDAPAAHESLLGLFADVNLLDGDWITLTVVGNTNPALVTPTLYGSGSQVQNSQLQLDFTPNQHGSTTLTIRATDTYDEWVETQIEVNVAAVNDEPMLVDSSVWACDENSYVQRDLHDYFDDAETADDDLTFAIVPGSATLGTVELLPDGHTVRFTAAENVNGLGSFQVDVTDTGDAGAAPKTKRQLFDVDIAPINDPPHADPTTLETAEDQAVEVDLWTLVEDTETPDAQLTFSVGNAQNGMVILLGDGHTARFTPTENYNGTAASFTYSVTDTGDGSQPPETSGPVTIDVTVLPVNDPPEAQTASVSTDEDVPLTIDLHTLASDVETPDANLSFEINSSDGGNAVLQADGHTVVFTPMEHYNGPAGFTYSVSDTGDGPSEATTVGPVAVNITVDPVNDAPTAADGSAQTDEDTHVDVDLRTWASDLETPNDQLVFDVGGATHGSVQLLGDGHTARFTPSTNYNGPASFTYTVEDTGDGGTAAKTAGPATIDVTVDPVNDLPEAQTASLSTDEDVPLPIDLHTLASDVETPDANLSFAIDSQSGGTAVLQLDGHTVVFTPTNNYNGPAGFTYSVTDTGDGADGPATVGPVAVDITVDPVNDAPTAAGGSTNTDEDTHVDVDLRTLASDEETADDQLIFNVGGATHGSVQLLGDGHTARFMPSTNYNGSAASFTYTVEDTGDGSAPAKMAGPATVDVMVYPLNDAPVVEDQSFTVNPDLPEPVTVSTVAITDPDVGDTHKFAFTAGDPSVGLTYFAIDEDTGVITATDTESLQALPDGTIFELTVEVTDMGGAGLSDDAVITITVVSNQPPDAQDDDFATDEGLPVSGNVLDANGNGADSDPEGDTFWVTTTGTNMFTGKGALYSLDAAGNMTYDPNGQFDYLGAGEPGTDTFVYEIEDSFGGTDEATVTVTITGVNDAPVLSPADPASSISEDALLTATLSYFINGDPGTTIITDVDSSDTVGGIAVIGAVGNGMLAYSLNGTTFTDVTLPPSADSALLLPFDAYIRYTADTENGETATITYRAWDATSGSAGDTGVDTTVNSGSTSFSAAVDTLTLDVTDVNDAPVLTAAGPSTSTDKDTPATVPITDFVNNGAETTTITDVDNGATVGGIAVVGAVGNGTLAYSLDGTNYTTVTFALTNHSALLLPFNAHIRYTPDGLSSETAMLTYRAWDMTSGTAGQSGVDTTANGGTTAFSDITDTATIVVTDVSDGNVDVYLIVRQTATPQGEAMGGTLPDSIAAVPVGTSYVVEIWMQDTWDASLPGGPSPGLSGGQFDLSYNTTLSDAVSMHYEGPFNLHGTFDTGTIVEGSGLVDDFGAATLDPVVGVKPDYARLGYITFDASSIGTQQFSLGDEAAVRRGLGNVDTSQIDLSGASVNQVLPEALTFAIDHSSMVVSGWINGAELKPNPAPAGVAAGLSGTLDVIIDDLDSPTILQIQSGSMDVATNIGDGKFRPGIDGADSTAYGDFAFESKTGELIELALRNILFDFSSTILSVSGYERFSAEQVQMEVNGGALDVRSSSMGGHGYDMAELLAAAKDEELGILVETTTSGVYELSFVYNRTIDISGLSSSIAVGSYLTLQGTIAAEYSLDGAPLMGTEGGQSDQGGTGVYMTLSQDPTSVAAGGQLATLPRSDAWVDEWDSYWVEVWARTDQSSGLRAANVDLQYNADYFTATQIDHGGTFVEGATGEIEQSGFVLDLGGSTMLTNVGGSGFALIGRVKFESLEGNGVDVDPDDLAIGPHDLGLRLDDVLVELVGGGAAEATVGQAPDTELWAVPYDVDDDGRIGLGDLSFFAAAYGEDTIDPQSAFAATLDFDHDGKVGLGDLSYLAGNYGLARGGPHDVIFPDSFTQRWIGAGLEVEGDSTVGQLLDLAVETWQEALGLADPIDIQLVVTDFDSAQLGEAVILEVDENGIPTSGRVTVDDDAGGLGWQAQLDAAAAEDRYDLYTVFLHEIGHALGFTSAYEGFAEYLESDGHSVVFVAPGISVEMDDAGNHVADDSLTDDVMSAMLSPGVRKIISDLDVQMLHAAYQAASNGADGYSGVGAPVLAMVDSTDAVLSAATSTAELGRLDRALDGDFTWDRLLRGGLGEDRVDNDLAPARAIDWYHTTLPTADDDVSVGSRSHAISRYGEVNGELTQKSFDELAVTRTSRQAEEGIADVLLADWDQWFA